MDTSNILNLRDFDSFLTWLSSNHDKEKEVVIYIYKKDSKAKGIRYEDAVMAALCYGWIDSTMHSYDDDKFILRFSPRKKNSNWSLSNIKRMKELIDLKLMTLHGLKFFDISTLDELDQLIEKDKSEKLGNIILPTYIESYLKKYKVYEKFIGLRYSQKKRLIYWIESAKKDETKGRRLKSLVEKLSANDNFDSL